jgi:hypothetical protein
LYNFVKEDKMDLNFYEEILKGKTPEEVYEYFNEIPVKEEEIRLCMMFKTEEELLNSGWVEPLDSFNYFQLEKKKSKPLINPEMKEFLGKSVMVTFNLKNKNFRIKDISPRFPKTGFNTCYEMFSKVLLPEEYPEYYV